MNKKVMISLNPLVLQALDAVAKSQMDSRSHIIAQALVNHPDIYEILEELKRGAKNE